VERITVVHGDTDVIPKGGFTGGSRSAQRAGAAVAVATDDLVAQARSQAAQLLEAAVGDVVLDVEAGVFHVAGAPGAATVDWKALAVGWGEAHPTDDGPELLACEADYEGDGASVPFGFYAAVVTVDTGTGKVTLDRLVSVDDAGNVLSPMLVEGQLHGGIGQAVGQALFEEFVYDADGNPITGSFLDYGVPSAAEMPFFDVHIVEHPSPNNILGVKGIAESGTIGAVPAIQNAVIDALADFGVAHIELPATPERVWQALRDAADAGKAAGG
jgi:carbon-monoxide dehydrogenase large subunit